MHWRDLSIRFLLTVFSDAFMLSFEGEPGDNKKEDNCSKCKIILTDCNLIIEATKLILDFQFVAEMF